MPMLSRICLEDYEIPDHNFRIQKGLPIIIFFLRLHYNRNICPAARKFDPERFNAEEIAKRYSFSYLPFGEGPKLCIDE